MIKERLDLADVKVTMVRLVHSGLISLCGEKAGGKGGENKIGILLFNGEVSHMRKMYTNLRRFLYGLNPPIQFLQGSIYHI